MSQTGSEVSRREGRSVLGGIGRSQKGEWVATKKVKSGESFEKEGRHFTGNGAKAGWGRGQTTDFSASLLRVAKGGWLG